MCQDFVQLAADCPVGFSRLAFHFLYVAAGPDKHLEKLQTFRREAGKRGKLELADNAGAAHSAVQLCDNERGGATGTGLGDKGHFVLQ